MAFRRFPPKDFSIRPYIGRSSAYALKMPRRRTRSWNWSGPGFAPSSRCFAMRRFGSATTFLWKRLKRRNNLLPTARQASPGVYRDRGDELMAVRCGIDLGTTYSSISWFDAYNNRVDTIDLESADGLKIMRSVVY